MGYISVADGQHGSIFIRLAVITFPNPEIARNSDKIWPYSSYRSSKVIDLGVNRKPRCDFLLVINGNFGRICYRFRVIDVSRQKMACFSTPPLFDATVQGDPFWILWWNLAS